jgi:predicted nucleic acid-binding protein
MNAVFADTSFYLAIVNPSDVEHETARAWSQSYRGRVVTTEYVLVETGNSLTRGRDREVFTALWNQVHEDPDTTIAPASPELLNEGFSLFAARLDKTWSLTDCISFTVMRQLGLTDALTADRHFEQAGFVIPLKAQ